MDYLSGLTNSSVYEFPYSGSHSSSLPFLNYNPNQFSTFNVNSTPQITTSRGNNVIVYHVPDSVPLDMILRQLGIDVDSINQPSSLRNYYTSTPLSVDFVFPPPRHRRRRRRIICRETTDSESEDNRRHKSTDDRRYKPNDDRQYNSNNVRDNRGPPNIEPVRPQPSQVSIHNLLDSVWQKSKNAPQSNAIPNMNPQMPSQGANTSNQPNSAVANMWNRAVNTGQHSPPSNLNSPWNQMSGGGGGGGGGGPPPAMNSMWSRMSGAASPPQQPSPPMNPMWNQMSGGGAPPPQQPSPPMNSMWGQMSGGGGAPPPQQPSPPMNSMWGQMSGGGGAPPPQQPPSYYSPPMGAPQQGSYSAPSPALTSLFGQPRPQY